MNSIIPAVLKTVGGVVQSGVNYLFNRNLQAQQNAYNERMIDKMNSYNSPSATMNRLMSAGISPKAAQLAVTDNPTAGLQSSANVATPYPGVAPASDYQQAMQSMYANELTSSQTQSVRAHDLLDRQRLELDTKEVSQKIQESMATVRNLDSKTMTEDMLRLFRRQEQPYQIKLLEQEAIKGEIACAAWNSLTPEQKKQYGFRSGQQLLDDAKYQSLKSKANVDNFELENKLAIKRFQRDFDQAVYDRKELGEKTRVLHNLYNSLDAGFTYDLKAYGWSSQQIDHYLSKKDQIFKNFDLSLDNEGLAGLVLKKSLTYQNLDNKGFAMRTALGLTGQLFETAMKSRNLLPLDPKVKTGFKLFDN